MKLSTILWNILLHSENIVLSCENIVLHFENIVLHSENIVLHTENYYTLKTLSTLWNQHYKWFYTDTDTDKVPAGKFLGNTIRLLKPVYSDRFIFLIIMSLELELGSKSCKYSLRN